jgi:hypothetical protein
MRRFEEATTAHQDATAIYRDTADRQREAGALNNLGLALSGWAGAHRPQRRASRPCCSAEPGRYGWAGAVSAVAGTG